MKTLRCACCGERTKGKQHWNRDGGYGHCPKCVHFLIAKGAEGELSGTPGVHFAAPLSLDCKPGMLVGWKTRDQGGEWDNWHTGVLKEFDNGTAIIREIDECDENHEVAVRCV